MRVSDSFVLWCSEVWGWWVGGCGDGVVGLMGGWVGVVGSCGGVCVVGGNWGVVVVCRWGGSGRVDRRGGGFGRCGSSRVG